MSNASITQRVRKNSGVINDLIETLKDGEQGFRLASDEVSSPELKNLFSQFAQQRGGFVGELQALARGFLDKDPESS